MRRRPFSLIIEESKRRRPLALIIEDEEHLATAFADALQFLAFETEIVQDGEQAFSRLGEIVPRIVVLDLNLPTIPGTHSLRHTGMGVLHKLRADPRLTETRIIIATGDARAAEHLSDQADLVLIKPITCEQLQKFAVRLISR
jgi:CheY-like chemotaxis protein